MLLYLLLYQPHKITKGGNSIITAFSGNIFHHMTGIFSIKKYLCIIIY